MTVYKRSTGYKVYNIMLILPKETIKPLDKIHKKLRELCLWQHNPKLAHISVKYLGYHKNYSKKYVLSLLPEINKIAKDFLPLNLTMTGIKLHRDLSSDKIDIFILFKKDKKLQGLHNTLKKRLGNKIDHFTEWEGSHFLPHVTIANCSRSNLKEIKNKLNEIKIPKKSFIANKLALHTKTDIIRI